MATIDFDDKEALYENASIPEKNKVTAPNVNLIKLVSNQILKTLGVYTDNWSSSSTYNIGDIAIYDNRVFENLTGTNTATTPDQDTTNWEETTIASMAAGAASGDTLPIGSIMPYGKDTAPANWLVCDGSAVSRTTYANLFAVIGTSFGSGDGSTTFNLPNLKGRVAVGQDTSDTDFDAMGETGGSKNAVVVSHDHNNTNNAISWVGNSGLGNTNWLSADGKQVTYSTIANPNDGAKAGWMGNTNKVVSSSGESGTGKNLQPYQVVCYIIKADQSAGLVANVSKTYSTSEDDTYACSYINGIIESGSNANGYYTKYADGTLICRYFVGPITTNAGAGTTTQVTFPYDFVDVNWMTQLTMTNGQSYWSNVACNVSDKSKTGFNLKTWNNGGGTNSGQYFDYITIGRWK